MDIFSNPQLLQTLHRFVFLSGQKVLIEKLLSRIDCASLNADLYLTNLLSDIEIEVAQKKRELGWD